ncbi:hypothetical protein OT109_09885 [Phycisphaeraceae bacterium D3-23]
MRTRLLRQLATLTLTATCVFALTTPVPGQFMLAPEAPVERLARNLGAYLDENPDNAEAHFMLARVHYIAFAQNSPVIRAMSEGSAQELPRLADPKLQWGLDDQPDFDEDALVEHALNAITHFEHAIALDQENALYRLGLASILEQAADYADLIGPLEDLAPESPATEGESDEDAEKAAEAKSDEDLGETEEAGDADPESGDKPLYDTYIDRAIDENFRAYELHREEAVASDHIMHPFFPIAYEAGKAYLRLVEEHRVEPVDEELAAQINADIAAIDAKPQAITPIIFRVEGDAPTHLDELLDPALQVDFDLDGDGTAERRPWVRPDTALLVWDPQRTGEITSGKQLFGNMTFFMLFDDGYQALDALDNNRDGQLAGDELLGLALWHDRNANAISDPGEVTPIEDTAVRSIATTQTGLEDIHPRSNAGLVLSNGETRPTWDWIAHEIMVETP